MTNVVAGGLLAALSLTLSLEAVVSDAVAQDWLPFRVAASLAPSSRWSDIYPEGAISQLFDVPGALRAAAAAHVERDGPPAISGNALTAFVSPPPAAFLLWPLTMVSSPTALILSRLALALPLVATMIVFAAVGCRDPDMRLRWSLLCLVAYPLLSYTVGIGQPSAWLFAAVGASLVTVRWVDVMGAVALGLAAMTKATPVGVAIALMVLGRRRLGGVRLGVAAVVTALTAPRSGVDAWQRFASIGSHIGRSVVTDWNNASIDADVIDG
ncbi:MAG: glycosyltransferase family 87 protein [Vicinamibacterales bacterium]